MRVALILSLGFMLGACSGSVPPAISLSPTTAAPPPSEPPPAAPAQAPNISGIDVVRVIKQAGDEQHLSAPILISSPDAANAINPAPWVVCLKSGAPEQGRRLYAMLFQGDKLVATRPSAVIDKCETREFTPLNVGLLQPQPKPGKKADKKSAKSQ